MIKRNKKGQFLKGTHWKKPQKYWNKNFLLKEYVERKKSAKQIAKENNCKENNILYFLNKFGIKTRTMKEIRKIKYWALTGKINGMYGKTGKLNPNWKGGTTPERQAMYAKSIWRELNKSIMKRDNYTCQHCGYYRKDNKRKLVIHHIKSWAEYPELRFEPFNLITLCENCHRKVHSKKIKLRLVSRGGVK